MGHGLLFHTLLLLGLLWLWGLLYWWAGRKSGRGTVGSYGFLRDTLCTD